MMQLTGNQIYVARHMLGLGNRKNAFRNSHGSSKPVPVLDDLVAAGGAHRFDGVDDWLRRRYTYSLTRAAAEAVLRPDENVDAIIFMEEEVY